MEPCDLPDDPTIGDRELLYRRVYPAEQFIVEDHERGGWRISSAAFRNHKDRLTGREGGMSVFCESGTPDPTSLLVGYERHGLAAITAGLARECDQKIVRAPTVEHESHCDVCGSKPRTVLVAFADFATQYGWVVPMPSRPRLGTM